MMPDLADAGLGPTTLRIRETCLQYSDHALAFSSCCGMTAVQRAGNEPFSTRSIHDDRSETELLQRDFCLVTPESYILHMTSSQPARYFSSFRVSTATPAVSEAWTSTKWKEIEI